MRIKLTGWFMVVSATGLLGACGGQDTTDNDMSTLMNEEFVHGGAHQPHEKFLYVASIDKGGQDPDFIAVVGADPDNTADFGHIVNRVDMPQIGDELHHFGYNREQNRLMVPGLFSGTIQILEVSQARHPTITHHRNDLIANSGYIVPHTVIGLENTGTNQVTMIGANSASTGPGGMVELNSFTGEFQNVIGPPANRPDDVAPEYMYDVGINKEQNRMVTTTFGWPGNVAPGITVAGLGDTVNVWNWSTKTVLQTVNLGSGSGALEARWLYDHSQRIGFTNTPGTSKIWAWEDLDNDGVYNFSIVVNLSDFLIPTDMLLSHDDQFMYVANWFGNNVMQFNIQDPLHPVLVSQVTVPHAQMLRISPDNKRLYATNSLLSTWDDDGNFGPARNTGYGIFLIETHHNSGGGMQLHPHNGQPWVQFDSVQKANTTGQARPHQIFFDNGVTLAFGEH